MLDGPHSRFLERMESFAFNRLAPLADRIEAAGCFPTEAYEALAAEKLFALALPASHGGAEADALNLSLMIESICRVSPSAALLVFPSNAVLRIIARVGTDEQKDRLMPELAAGRTPMAFCLTEPDHGSDAANLQTRAERDGDHYVVNGSKAHITLGPNARYYLTFVRTGPGPGPKGVSALLIPGDTPGVGFGRVERKLGLHGSVTSMVYFNDARVPVANRLGGEGEGWRVLTEAAGPMRAWGAASMSLGMAQGMLDHCLAHARQAGADGKPRLVRQDVGFALADMKMKTEAARALVRQTCADVDTGQMPLEQAQTTVSMAKCLASDTAMEVAGRAHEVLGRRMASADDPVARLMCSAKAVQIFDGSNQIQRMIIARNMAREPARA